jgi:hypothetical protein
MNQNTVASNAGLNDSSPCDMDLPVRRSGVAFRCLALCLVVGPLWLMPVAEAAPETKPVSVGQSEPSTVGLTSRITEVMVLPQGAWVTRQIEVPADKVAPEANPVASSKNEQTGKPVVVLDLPGNIDQESVQVSSAELLQSGPLQWQKQAVETSPEFVALEAKIHALRGQEAEARDALEAAGVRLSIFEAQMSAPATVTTKAGHQAGAFLTQSAARQSFDKLLKSLMSDQRKARDELDQVDEALTKQQDKLAELRKQPEKMRLILPLERKKPAATATSSKPFTVQLRYRVNDAGWQPVYRADLITTPTAGTTAKALSEKPTAPQVTANTPANQIGDENAQLDWSFSASVHQNSGEDWTHVPITLSLLDNRRYYPAPTLPRWTIGFRHSRPESPEPFVGGGLAMKTMAVPSAVRPVDASGFNAEYRSRMPLTVPSGPETMVIPLQHEQVPAHAMVLIAPTVSPLGVLTGTFVLRNPLPLPAGHWSFFVNGTQSGSAFQQAQAPSQKMSLGFGPDRRVKVTVNQQPDQREENGVIGKSTQMVRRTTVEVQSQHKEPVAVTVIMNLPIAEDSQIFVETLADTTPPTTKQFDGIDGVWAWSNQIKPDQKITLNFGFRLRWPSDKTLSGF